ncbi:hypothetical protein UFOVP1597_14 [uncultured Caudovirales phage]|uniref:Uncharacterized protein n=1 Tax=uncultured Caudovirales phage TaxID=2100421 RepID=A0A6J5SVC4_9CAUD|nr:hypothetical protein UFOVP1597_14 [uncultured Caudovirales phage]
MMIKFLLKKFFQHKVLWDIKRNKRPLDDVWFEYSERMKKLDPKET